MTPGEDDLKKRRLDAVAELAAYIDETVAKAAQELLDSPDPWNPDGIATHGTEYVTFHHTIERGES